MIVNCLIPARGGSKRIPGKNLIDFCGKPLMVWSIEQAQACKQIDKVYVSSENAEILDCAVLHGAEVIARPNSLAGDNSTLEEVMKHFLKEVPTDILVVLQPTSPLRLPGDIDKALELKIPKMSVISGSKAEDIFLWYLQDKSELKEYFDWALVTNSASGVFNEKNFSLREMYNDYYIENGSFYILDKKSFKSDGFYTRYGDTTKMKWYLMHKWQSHEIDEPEDLRVCETLMKEFILK